MTERFIATIGFMALGLGLLSILAQATFRNTAWGARVRCWFRARNWESADWGTMAVTLSALLGSLMFQPRVVIGADRPLSLLWAALTVATGIVVVQPFFHARPPRGHRWLRWAGLAFVVLHLVVSW